MHRNKIIYALICINSHVLSCLISMLSILYIYFLSLVDFVKSVTISLLVLFVEVTLDYKEREIVQTTQHLHNANWWGHLNIKRRIQGDINAIQHKEKCLDLESTISSKQHAYLDEEIKESIIRRHLYIKRL